MRTRTLALRQSSSILTLAVALSMYAWFGFYFFFR